MKKIGLLLSLGVMFAWPGTSFPAGSGTQRNLSVAQPSQISPSLLNLLPQYPSGGEGLTTAIVAILDQDSSSAVPIVKLAATANADQKASIALALLRILHRTSPPDPGLVDRIRAAVQNSDPVFRAVLAALEAQLYAGLGGPASAFMSGPSFSSGGGGAAFVSPASPVSPN